MAEVTTTERPGSHADPGPAPDEPVDDGGYEVDWFDFEARDPNDRWAEGEEALDRAERSYEKWLGRS